MTEVGLTALLDGGSIRAPARFATLAQPSPAL